jgi:hypothetical protein
VNQDPIEHLDSFYEECHMAPVPATLLTQPIRLPVWVRLAIPVSSLSFGAVLAGLLIAGSFGESQQHGLEASRAWTRAQFNLAERTSQRTLEAASQIRSDNRRSQLINSGGDSSDRARLPLIAVRYGTSTIAREYEGGANWID